MPILPRCSILPRRAPIPVSPHTLNAIDKRTRFGVINGEAAQKQIDRLVGETVPGISRHPGHTDDRGEGDEEARWLFGERPDEVAGTPAAWVRPRPSPRRRQPARRASACSLPPRAQRQRSARARLRTFWTRVVTASKSVTSQGSYRKSTPADAEPGEGRGELAGVAFGRVWRAAHQHETHPFRLSQGKCALSRDPLRSARNQHHVVGVPVIGRGGQAIMGRSDARGTSRLPSASRPYAANGAAPARAVKMKSAASAGSNSGERSTTRTCWPGRSR